LEEIERVKMSDFTSFEKLRDEWREKAKHYEVKPDPALAVLDCVDELNAVIRVEKAASPVEEPVSVICPDCGHHLYESHTKTGCHWRQHGAIKPCPCMRKGLDRMPAESSPSPVEGNDALLRATILVDFIERKKIYILAEFESGGAALVKYAAELHAALSQTRPNGASSSPSDALREKVEAMRHMTIDSGVEVGWNMCLDAVLRLMENKT
jgi:hypothetical protein